ncbi:MAG: helix-turn-helix domain-containing protein [Mycobacteriales bacterium]
MNTHSHAPSLGAALAGRRLQLHLSRTELARRCDLPVADLRRIEHGRFVPSPAEAYRMADELEIDPQPLCRWAIRQLFIVHPEYLAEHAGRAA